MVMTEAVLSLLESPEPERLATGFTFTEGPLWHPDGFWYFVDVRESRLYRLVPGQQAELLRERTRGGNGTTFDLQGQLLLCEGEGRRVSRLGPDGKVVGPLVERFEGKRFNRPNDVVCKSDGSIYFTDPGLRVPLENREMAYSAIFRVATNGTVTKLAECEYPNGLAFSPDERTLYVANTRWSQYIHALKLDEAGDVISRTIFADMTSPERDGVPDGMKVDAEGRVFCTGPGGIWVFLPDGTHLGTIRTPEVTANIAFGGPDLRTLFLTSSTSVYTLRVKTPGVPHPWYTVAARG
jgi:gluconolactonase